MTQSSQTLGLFPKVEVIGAKRRPLDDVYHFVLTSSWVSFFGGVCGAFLSVNGLFALAYSAVPGSILHARPGSLQDAFFFSVQTMATIGYGNMREDGTRVIDYRHFRETIRVKSVGAAAPSK